jgi:hypothetical protein
VVGPLVVYISGVRMVSITKKVWGAENIIYTRGGCASVKSPL